MQNEHLISSQELCFENSGNIILRFEIVPLLNPPVVLISHSCFSPFFLEMSGTNYCCFNPDYLFIYFS